MLVEKSEYSTDFSFSFPVDKSYCTINQLSLDKFEMMLDNKPFSALIEESKNKRYETKKDSPPKKNKNE